MRDGSRKGANPKSFCDVRGSTSSPLGVGETPTGSPWQGAGAGHPAPPLCPWVGSGGIQRGAMPTPPPHTPSCTNQRHLEALSSSQERPSFATEQIFPSSLCRLFQTRGRALQGVLGVPCTGASCSCLKTLRGRFARTHLQEKNMGDALPRGQS